MEVVVAEAGGDREGDKLGVSMSLRLQTSMYLTGMQRLGSIRTAKGTTLPEAQGSQLTGMDLPGHGSQL